MNIDIEFSTTKHEELLDITDRVEEAIAKAGAKEGLVNIFLPHATSALIVNENHDPNVCVDLLRKINELIPLRDDYLHDRIDNNAAAHIKASLFKPECTLQIREGRLLLGTWQQVMVAEFDGPRNRKMNMKITKE